MRQTFTKHGVSASNPIANALVVLAGALIVGVTVVLGFFAFLILSAVVMVAASIIGVRVWWFKRQLRRTAGANTEPAKGNAGGDLIEGEFQVVDSDRDTP